MVYSRFDSAVIIGESPIMHFEVEAEFTVFAPQPGHILLGKVNLMSNDHIGMLVLGVFNASIPYSELPPSCAYDRQLGKWSIDGVPLEINETELSFEFKSFDFSDEAHAIKGSLKGEHLG